MDRAKDHYHGTYYDAQMTAGPSSILSPTKRLLPLENSCEQSALAADSQGSSLTNDGNDAPDQREAGSQKLQVAHRKSHNATAYHMWSSRDNRKGRHAIVIRKPPQGELALPFTLPTATTSTGAVSQGILKMGVRYPVWDISYDVAVIFTIGSIVWVINGFFVWLPLQSPATEFSGEVDAGGGWTAFIGATIFVAGSILLMLEAVNEDRSACFGWALREAVEGGSDGRLKLQKTQCRHHHVNRKAWLKGNESPNTEKYEGSSGEYDDNTQGNTGRPIGEKEENTNSQSKRTWEWWPTWHEFKTHYMWDLGFLACSSQMIGASIFWVAGLTGLPGILSILSVSQENVVFWTPQVVGGSGFIVSGALFMLETQPKWYVPAPRVLGWHIGLWNLIGAIGFTLCGALGYASVESSIEYASTLSTFIGSWAFLIGSVIQWYESLSKYPVSVLDDDEFVHAQNQAANVKRPNTRELEMDST